MARASHTLRHRVILKTAINEAHESHLLSRHDLTTDTIGRAGRYLQVNLVVLPSAYASDFRDLCARNPVPCPILGWTKQGDLSGVYPSGCIQTPDFDVRTDFPRYRVRVNGSLVAIKTDILDEWTDDHVAFLIGCSLSFERALKEAGHRICHEEDGKRPAMYKTNIPVLPAGVFCGGTVVVSMRTYEIEEVEQVRKITRPYLTTHGEPIAWRWDGAEAIGIKSVHGPDFGDRQTLKGDEVPVFWGCGVTPQAVVEAVGDGIKGTVMTHDPGFVMVTDWTVDDLPKLSACLRMESL
ncbi:Hypothetical protein NCS54_00630600 [Fusarium falciforme]|uniref:Hypothetical protein n=1 Tax=Fusarium falciforme TaxID=195108 RepID=UPI0023013723|nr:Hypothetical protein NCS54_00630600 [Fusarium falciforme]WAO88937.1 Hypothetical protein NCS54_00630600 [Fusarium falciforme]